jgi:PAS domain S-box-containing protein
LPDENVMSVAVDNQDRVFFGMFQEGVACLEGTKIRRLKSPDSKRPLMGSVSAILVDRKGRLWIGGEGVQVLDGDERSFSTARLLPRNAATFFMEDSQGRVWICADEGVHCFDGRELKSYSMAGHPGEATGVVLEDPRDGTILVSGNRTGNLYRLRQGQFEALVRAEDGSRFNGALIEKDGTLWLGADRSTNLRCLRNDHLIQLGSGIGLPSSHSFSPIVSDDRGNLWMGSLHGIIRLPRNELEAFLQGQAPTVVSQLFTKEDGLPTKDCTSQSQPIVSRDSQGRLWFGTVKGAVRVDPKLIRLNRTAPILTIDKVLRDDITVSVRNPLHTSAGAGTEPLLIPPGSGRLEIHYLGVSHSAPENVRYKYMLEGVDNDWIDVGNQRVAYLQPLRPGTFRFHVKAANNHGVWTDATTLVLVAQPFYWQTAWFQFSLVAGLMGGAGLVGWLATRDRLRRQIERFEQQQALAAEQARLASVLEATTDLVAFLDESGRILYLNPAGRRLVGIGRQASIESLKVSELYAPWASELILKEGIRKARQQGTWSGETALLHESGREIPVSQVIAVHRGTGETVQFLSTIARDISERKMTEEQLRGSLREKEALLREIHHRVKNNLQLINSLLALQAARVEDPSTGALFTESQNRVRTMALVHENLYRAGNLASIPLAAHVKSLCSYLFATFGEAASRIELYTEIEDMTLELDRAIPCGLIINELVSNALKHAFPDGRSGRVWVAFHVGPGTECALAVRDDGSGLPPGLDPLHAETMGLQLVKDLTEQLGGKLTAESEGGSTFTVRFRIDSRGRTEP